MLVKWGFHCGHDDLGDFCLQFKWEVHKFDSNSILSEWFDDWIGEISIKVHVMHKLRDVGGDHA